MLRAMPTSDRDIAETTRHPLVRAGLVVAVLAVLLTAALGGFRESKARSSVPEYAAGHTVENGPLRITPLRAWVARHAPGSAPDVRDPKQYLVLQLRVINLIDSDVGLSSDLKEDVLLRRPDAPKPESRLVKASTLQYARDHGFTVDFPPRLPVTVDLVWELPPDEAMPAMQGWGVAGRREQRTYMTQEKVWLQAYGVAKYRLPVEDRRNGPGPAP